MYKIFFIQIPLSQNHFYRADRISRFSSELRRKLDIYPLVLRMNQKCAYTIDQQRTNLI